MRPAIGFSLGFSFIEIHTSYNTCKVICVYTSRNFFKLSSSSCINPCVCDTFARARARALAIARALSPAADKTGFTELYPRTKRDSTASRV